MRQSERAYRVLHDDIVEWRLSPGAPLSETEVAVRLGISRTPVREALHRLAGEGLVQSVPGRGAVVAGISIQDVSHLFQLREALETQAVRICARSTDRVNFEPLRADLRRSVAEVESGDAAVYDTYYELIDRFDAAIDLGTGNPYLVAALREMRAHIRRIRRLAKRSPRRIKHASVEHLAICDAICAADERRAAQATAVHVRNSLQSTVTALMEDALTPAADQRMWPEMVDVASAEDG